MTQPVKLVKIHNKKEPSKSSTSGHKSKSSECVIQSLNITFTIISAPTIVAASNIIDNITYQSACFDIVSKASKAEYPIFAESLR